MDPKSIGQVAYDAYGESRDWRAFNGEEMRHWNDLPLAIQAAWGHVAEAVLNTPHIATPACN